MADDIEKDQALDESILQNADTELPDSLKDILDSRKSAVDLGRSGGSEPVIYERKVAIATLKEERTGAARQNESDMLGVLCESSKGHNNEHTKHKRPFSLRRLWAKFKRHKKLAIPLTIFVLLAGLLAVPYTRYALLGLFIKQDVRLTVYDSQTNVPISGVELNLRGKTAKTDTEGKATILGVKVGNGQLTATKKYYRDVAQNMVVTLGSAKKPTRVKLEATGRQVRISTINRVTSLGIEGATVKVADAEAKTDKNGNAILVLPPNKTEIQATISANGYNSAKIQINPYSEKPDSGVFALTPTGKVYFLSKQSGKIDVVKTDLDGGNRQTVLMGTGQEEETNTVLLATRDWKYLAVQARRESDKARLYLIDTSSDTLTEIDSGNATFTPIGWHDHYFVYKLNRDNVLVWQPKGAALKTFNAETKQLVTIEETAAEGSGANDYAAESLDNIYLLKDAVMYSKSWAANYYSNYRLADKHMGIYSIKPNGTGKQILKDFAVGTYAYISAVAVKPDEIYLSVNTSGGARYFEYQAGSVKEVQTINGDSFNRSYPTYLASHGGQATFWYEPRDGKNTLLIGTVNGDNPKEIASLSEYTPYGWYGDSYLLVSKGGSELFIMSVAGPGNTGQVLKVTDYHKPNISFRGYGGI